MIYFQVSLGCRGSRIVHTTLTALGILRYNWSAYALLQGGFELTSLRWHHSERPIHLEAGTQRPFPISLSHLVRHERSGDPP